MPLGIIDDTKLRPVPGTATLEDLNGRRRIEGLGPNVKRDRDGYILVPQPSDDPKDPLNWPLWQRDTITTLLCILSVLASTLSPLLAANTIVLIEWFGLTSVTDAALLTGYHLMGVGVAGPIFVATARVWGKRHLFVIAPLIIIASSIWGGCAGRSYNSLVAARFFQGVGLAPFEGLVNAAVGDMYFVHESGKRLALTNMCLFGGAFFTPVIVGKATDTLGWQWTFWLVAIFTAVVFPFVFLYCPETTYPRSDPFAGSSSHLVEADRELQYSTGSRNNSQHLTTGQSEPSFEAKRSNASEKLEEVSSTNTETYAPVIHTPVQRRMFSRENLALFSGRKSPENIFVLFIRPFALYLQPGILWACLIQGGMIAWTAFMGVSLALIMLGFGFTETQTGYMYAGAFIGAMLAFALAGIISDPLAKWMTRRNNGIFEPEFRIVLVLPMAAIGITGLFGFGYAASQKTLGWALPDVFFGFVVGGMTLGAIVSAQYIVDAHRDVSVEGFTCMLMFKNFLAFAVTFKGIQLYLDTGARRMFYTLGYIQIGICALSIPMYILGKKNRSFFARYDILRMLRLR